MWKDIEGFEGIYQISDRGEVKSLKRTAPTQYGYRTVRERVLKPTHSEYGYPLVRLSKDNQCRTFLVHRLVAKAFIPNPDNLPCINHKDANPNNNCVDNLEWCTHKYNSNYYICKERQRLHMLGRYEDDPDFLESCKKRLEKYHSQFSKRVCQLDLGGNLIKVWDSTRATVSDGFIPNDVGQCANGKRRTHHGFMWVWFDDFERS